MQLLSLTLRTAYNFAADSLRLAPLTVTAGSSALSPDLLFSAGAMYDFYSYDPLSGVRVNRFNSEDGHGVVRFIRGFLNMTQSFQGSREGGSSPRPTLSGPEDPELALFRERFNTRDLSSVDYSLPWQLRLSLYLQTDRTNPLIAPQTTAMLSTVAKVALSKNWQAEVNTGYDLQTREVVFPMLQLFRDLHCWQMGFQWVPSGPFKSYSFQIGLKAPQLSDFRFKTGGGATGWN